MKESAVTSHVRLEAAQHNIELWRNNCGGFYDETGRFVRYGLGNFTEKQGIKSSDYIGIRPVFITPNMVGSIVGVFAAVEFKNAEWQFNNSDKHLLAQKKFIDIVQAAGGYAGFVTCVEDFRKVMRYA